MIFHTEPIKLIRGISPLISDINEALIITFLTWLKKFGDKTTPKIEIRFAPFKIEKKLR